MREDLGSRETFKQFDKDGDGVITANDLGHALFTLGQEPTDGELADMIKEVDLNGEGGEHRWGKRASWIGCRGHA